MGDGVVLEGYQSVRDELVQTQIQQETQAQSGANAQLARCSRSSLPSPLRRRTSGRRCRPCSRAFRVSRPTQPAPLHARQCSQPDRIWPPLSIPLRTTLTSQQTSLNTQVTQDVSQINQLTQQIAALNPQIAALKANGQDGGTLEDQQNQLILRLSTLTNVAVTQSNDGVTLSTGNGTPLVVGSQSFALQTTTGSDGMTHVLDQNGTDITTSLTSGDLGGTIQTRDTTIPGLLNQLDTLANQFGSAINAAQASGFDQNGNAGQNFFTVPTTVAGSAATITMAHHGSGLDRRQFRRHRRKQREPGQSQRSADDCASFRRRLLATRMRVWSIRWAA